MFLAGTETQDQEQACTQVNILTHSAHILKQLTTGPEHGSGCKWPTCTLEQLSPRCGGCAFCTRGFSTRDLSGAPLNAGVELQRRPAARRCRHQRVSLWESTSIETSSAAATDNTFRQLLDSPWKSERVYSPIHGLP